MSIEPTERGLARARELMSQEKPARSVALALDELEAQCAALGGESLDARAELGALREQIRQRMKLAKIAPATRFVEGCKHALTDLGGAD